MNIAYLIGSTVVVERVFDLNGLGSLLLTAISRARLPGRPVHHARARDRRRARQPRSPTCSPRGSTHASASDERCRSTRRRRSSSARARRSTFWRRARKSRSLVAGTTILIGLIALAAILAPVISPLSARPPGPLPHPRRVLVGKHLLGTDELGRDELSRLLYAARTDLKVGVLAIVFPFCFGTLVGHDRRLLRRHRRRGHDARSSMS